MIDNPVPEKIGRFAVRRVIGQGGMGTVYLGHDEELDRAVALKVLHDDDMQKERGTRSLREARSAAAIRHPNVATIYEVGKTTGDLTYIAMEYCEGETLSAVIREQRIDLRRFVRIASQIAAGLAAAHDNGVIHRDIKSSNILIEEGDLVKILDFGLAKSFESANTATTLPEASTVTKFFGTVPYISPEQAAGRSSDARSDLFATGVVLYEMITGHLPFRAENPLALIQKIREEEPEPMTNAKFVIPPQLGSIISRLLQKKPDDRYGSARQLLQALRDLELELTESRTWTLPDHSGFRLPRTNRRLRLTGMASILVIFTVLALAGWYISNRTSITPPSQSGPIESLAVLPLRNLSGDATDDFLSVGIPDALIVRLQQIQYLQVRPTSSILSYRDRDIPVLEAARELDVDAVLEGHFIRSGQQIRVNLQLIDARTNYGIWAGAVDGTREDLLALMDQVATRTVDALKENLSSKEITSRSEPNTSSPDAYEEYLRARSLTGSLLAEDHEQQIRSLLRSIELDPEFAAAYAELAIALSLGEVRGLRTIDGLQTPEWYARQAVRIDPNLAEAHVALSRALVRQPDRFRESLRENLAALRINPNEPNALSALTSYFISIGDLRRAECVKRRFVELDPSSNDARTRGYWSINAVDPESALREAKLAVRSDETALAGHDIEAMAYLTRGDIDSAKRSAMAAVEIAPDHYIASSLQAMIAAAEGDRDRALERIEEFRDQASGMNHWAAFRVGLTFARLGDYERALDWLRTSVSLGNHSWYLFVRHPWLAPLQTEPEFQQLLSSVRSELDDVHDDAVGMHRLLCETPE